jgi:hypothetical protein
MIEYPHLSRDDVDPAELAADKTPPLSQTANARRRRLEGFISFYQREHLRIIDGISDAKAREDALALGLDPDELVREKHATADKLRQSLQEGRKDNAARQARYRA